jgi:GT2 family glycosyltransferase
MPAHAALHLLLRAARGEGDFACARQVARALLARHGGDSAARGALTQSSSPTARPARCGDDGGSADPALPLCSIVILVHNQLEHTRRCIESLLAGPAVRCELIVVDNASSDGTGEYLTGLDPAPASLRIIVNRTNRGYAAGNNQGLAVARGEYVVLLNNDTVVTEQWLAAMLAVFTRHPATGIVGPRSNRVSGKQQIDVVGYRNLDELPAFAAAWSAKHAGESRVVDRVVGFCLLARREVIEAVGGLDEQFGTGNFEDDDFCIRAHLAGFETRIADDAFVHHVGNATFNGAGIDYARAMRTNWDLFKRKWAIPPEISAVPGYVRPKALPPGVALKVPLPDLERTHLRSPDRSCWQDRGAARGGVPPVPAEISRSQTPRPAPAGDLAAARDQWRRKQLAAAWAETVAAIESRAFHPEAFLLLAEIAQAAGDGVSAQRCVRHVQKTAPKFRPNDPLFKTRFRGNAKRDWLVLPGAVQPIGLP